MLAIGRAVVGCLAGACFIAVAFSETESVEAVRGLIKAKDYAAAEQAARALLAETEASHGSGSLETARVLDLLVESLWRGGNAGVPETRPLADRALEIKERLLGPEHMDLLPSLDNLAGILKKTDAVPQAKPIYERALVIQEKASGPDHLDRARWLEKLAYVLHWTGDYAAALASVERAAAIYEKALGPDDAQLAGALHRVCINARMAGDHDRERVACERGLAIREALYGPEHRDVADSLNALGIARQVSGDLDAALPLYERCLAIREKALGPDHPDVAEVLNNIAGLLLERGDAFAAIPLFERTVAIEEKTLGPMDRRLAGTLQNLAGVHTTLGDYGKAIPLFERAIAIRTEVLGPEHPDLIRPLSNLANALITVGDFEGARLRCERAIAIGEASLGPEHPDVSEPHETLSRALLATGDAAGARRAADKALSIIEKAMGPHHPEYAERLYAVAEVAYESGDLAGARPLLEMALQSGEEAFGPGHFKVTRVLDDLAELLSRTGEPEKARQLLDRVIADKRRIYGADSVYEGTSLRILAGVLVASGRPAEALDAALRAEAISREHLALIAGSLPERLALDYTRTRTIGLDPALSLAAKGLDPESLRAVWDATIRSRALVLDELAARHRMAADSSDAKIASLRRNLSTARTRLAELVVRGPDPDEMDRYRSSLDKAGREKEALETELAGWSVAFRREVSRRRVGFEEVAQALPRGSALVAYVHYRREPEEGTLASSGPDAPIPSYGAWVLPSRDAVPRFVPLGPAERLDELTNAWRQSMTSVRGMAPPAARLAEQRYRTEAAQLRSALWDPLRVPLEGARQVFVVPDGAVHLVNFATLPAARGEHYLVETGPTVHLLSAERDLVRPAAAEPSAGLLALGGPDFERASDSPLVVASAVAGASTAPAEVSAAYRGPAPACADFRTRSFDPLPGTGAEVESIARLWSTARTGEDRGEVLKLTGPFATEEAFKRLASTRRVLHLATHGFFAPERCSAAATPSGENPLLLSGLVLAGANMRNARDATRESGEDGILTAEEIASLDLSGVQWVVLSACETGVGEVRTGEGVLGLRRAFETAGASSLILSLWPVEDQSARTWMLALYRLRLAGWSTAEAVRRADLEVLEERRRRRLDTHPFYWGGFVAAGDWR